MVDKIKQNMEKIQNELNFKQTRNINEYMKLDSKDRETFVKWTFIFFEEFSYLLDLIWELWNSEKAEFITNIKTLIKVGRSSGNNVILSLQKPVVEDLGSNSIKEMIRPISFKALWAWEVVAFWEKTWLELDKLNIGEACLFLEGRYVKFQSFYIEKSTLDRLKLDFKEENKDLIQEDWINDNISLFIKAAEARWILSLADSEKYNVSRRNFDKISQEMQSSWRVVRNKENKLIFVNPNPNKSTTEQNSSD